MKIGLVLDDTLDTPDGVQQYVLNVGKWLSLRGYEVHYLVGNTTRTDLPNVHSLSRNLRVKFNGNRMSVPLPGSKRKLRSFLVTEQFDVLHVQVPYSPFLAGRLLNVAPSQTAVVGTFHILPYSRFVALANHGLALLNQRSANRFDRMLAVSAPAQEFARRVYGYAAAVVPNPVNLAQFAAAASESRSLNIVFLGRLVARKGAQHLLNAVAYMHEHRLYQGDFKVYIGGKGELMPQLQQFVVEHGLEAMVHFEGFVDEAKKPDFLAQADIAVFPSTSGESFGIVLLEGMAASRGVVLAGNNPGYASVMFDQKMVLDPRDISVFAAQLASWLSNAPARMQAAGDQKEYVKKFDIQVVGEALLQIYGEALQSRRKS